MVIISPKLWQWALLIFIKTLSLDIEGGAAGTSCSLDENLDVLNTTDSVIRDEGFYLLKDTISCSGRITLIELCGVFTSSFTNVDFSRVYLYAALYKPRIVNGTHSLERITEPERLESGLRVFDGPGVTLVCERLSLVEYNWTASENNILGVRFNKSESSCESQTFKLISIQTCPLNAAVQTNRPSDVVNLMDTPDVIYNSSIKLEELSNITEVKINLRTIVEPLPPLFSEVCDSQKKRIASDPTRSEKVIMNPSEEQLFTGSGTYIMNEEIKCNGVVTSVSYCGALMDEREPWPQPSRYRFTLLHLRLSGDRYDIINRVIVDYERIDEANTNLNLICQSHIKISELLARQGDQFGVIMFAHCEQSQFSKKNYCPIKIGLNNTGCTDTSLFVTDSVDYSEGSKTSQPDSIPKSNMSMVAIKLNFEIHYDVVGECPNTQNHNHLYIGYGISAAFIVIIVLLIVLSVVLMVKLNRSKPHIYDAIKRGVRQGSTRLRNTLSRRNENNPGIIHGIENRSFSDQNEYSSNYNNKPNAQADSQQRGNTINLGTCHQASLLTGSYEEPIDAINHYEQGDTEDLYIDPPCKERELKNQLQKLEFLKENIQVKEYLGSGRFGIVYRGLLTVTGVDSEGGVKEVAVKTMENGASEEERVKFLQEAAIMGQFNNPYIIKIYGAIITSQPYMIVCELMNKGDLRRYLHTLKISDAQDAGTEIGVILLNFSRQVANAMMYLSGKGFVHRDLAARNILVSMDRICKVSDFGLSRDLHDDDYYVAHGGLIPVRWTAPEALKQRKYSTASDVWSYGVVLFEIWSLASRPYGTLTNEQVLRQVFAGYRLPSPAGCPRAVYNLMISCWHPEAAKRTTFAQLHTSLQQSDSVLLEWSEDERAKYSENARTIGMMYQDGEMLHSTLQKTYVVSGTQK